MPVSPLRLHLQIPSPHCSTPLRETPPRLQPANKGVCANQARQPTASIWVYRLDGPRKCWFQVAERSATVKKLVHDYAAKQRVVAPEENEAAQRKPNAVVGDGRAEPLPPAPAETSRLASPVRELKVVHADSLIAAGAAALVPRAPVVAKPATEQLAPDYPKQRPVDVEPPLETAPSANDTIASYVPAATSVAVPIAEADEEKRGWRETWLGVLLIALGLISLMSSSATLRGYRAGRAISRSEDKSTANRRTFSVWDDADQRADNFHVTRRHSVGKIDVTEIGHHGARHHLPVPKLAQQ